MRRTTGRVSGVTTVRLEQPGRGHGAEDDDGRGPHAGGGGDVDHVVQARARDALTGQGALLDQGDRRGRVAPRRRAPAWPGSASALTPMRTTTVHDPSRRPVSAADDQPSCPFITCTAPTVPRCVSGMPAAAGAANALLTPGMTSTGDAGLPAGEHLLAAPAVHERVAALEPHDDAAALGLLDQDPADLVLRHRVVARASCRRR